MNNVSDYAAQDRLIEKLKEEVCYLDNILALMPGYVYWLDSNNVFLGCNNMLVELFNIDSREQIVGKNNFDFLDKPQAELLDAANNKVMENGEPYIFEETIKWPDSDKTYLTHKVPLKNMQGQIVGLLGVSFDISDRKKVEEELRLMALSNQAKTDFIRNMEHDIRTPLSGMLSVASHLASIETDPTKKELLMDLENASQELIGYLNTIIEVSRMDEGRVPAIMQEFNFEHMVKSMFMLELPAAKSKKIDFILAYDDAIPEKVVGDSFRAYRILLNLVSNAIKFTDQGFVKINIKLLEKNEQNIKVECSILDSGIGIDQGEKEKIYEKFSRGAAVNNRAYKGMGLGLWIVKEFVRDLEGTIRLDSQPGKGSCFTCTLIFKLPCHIDGPI